MTLGHDVSTACLHADCSVWWFVWGSGPEAAELNERRSESGGGLWRSAVSQLDSIVRTWSLYRLLESRAHWSERLVAAGLVLGFLPS